MEKTRFEQWQENKRVIPSMVAGDRKAGYWVLILEEEKMQEDLPHNPDYRAYMLGEFPIG